MFDGFHEGEGIAVRAPGVQRQHFSRMMEQDKRTVVAFQVFAQELERGVQSAGLALQAYVSETCGEMNRFPAEFLSSGDLT